jgi:putative tricarboxylic transport membrane protein
MTHQAAARQDWIGVLLRKNVLSGLMFMAVALLGLWLSRNYPVGTALRMGTGYVPRLLCWVLLALGAAVALQGVFGANEQVSEEGSPWRALVFVSLSLIAFALTVERLGLAVGSAALIFVGAIASRHLRIVEVAVAALILVTMCVAIFIWGLALPISIWPEW